MAAACAWPQGVLSGVVTDTAGAPLPFATVGVPSLGIGVAAGTDGRYSLAVGAADSVTVVFSFTGFRRHEARVLVRGAVRLDAALHPGALMIDGVEVSDDRSRTSPFESVDVGRLDDAVGPLGGVESLIKLLPDVQSNNEMSSQYSVRGGSFDENLVYINGVEVMRPMLIRSAQQEGMSIVNPDLVEFILFSPGGFDASFGDKLSSVLDITYSRPATTTGRVSASLLGGSATVRGRASRLLDYAVGARYHSNSYLLGSLDTRGSYTTAYTDLQAIVGLHPSERLDLGLMLIGTRNVYGLVPESQTTTFGGFFNPMSLRIYFDGQEQDRYATLLGAFTADYRPSDRWRLQATLAVQHLDESERYDVQDQYFLYEVTQGEQAGDTIQFDRGVGTFLEHARNRLLTTVASAEFRATRTDSRGRWVGGVKVQGERVADRLREWRWVDSAGYSLPSLWGEPGDPLNAPANPLLQDFVSAENSLLTLRASAFAQREADFTLRSGAGLHAWAGLRGQAYVCDGRLSALASPRLGVSYKPQWQRDVVLRLAGGVYRQAPFYREYRRSDGSLRTGLDPQTSYQATASADWRFMLWQRPFALTADLYGKWLTDVVPYTVDNLRLRYMPDSRAEAYAVGVSVRVGGELVDGLESWASLSVMRTAESVDGGKWRPRPTDQRVGFKLFLQDNLPTIPWWRMSLSLVYGSGTPVTVPMDGTGDALFRLPAYYRVDWGNTVKLTQFEAVRNLPWLRRVADVQLGIEVFNLFNFRNVVSYLWVADYTNIYYPVPNYLTARQLNVKLTVDF